MGGGRQPAAEEARGGAAWRLFAEDREAAASVTAGLSVASDGHARMFRMRSGLRGWRSWATDVERRQDAALGALLRRIADRTRLLKAGAHAIRCLGDEADRRRADRPLAEALAALTRKATAHGALRRWRGWMSRRSGWLTLSGAAHLSARLWLLQRLVRVLKAAGRGLHRRPRGVSKRSASSGGARGADGSSLSRRSGCVGRCDQRRRRRHGWVEEAQPAG